MTAEIAMTDAGIPMGEGFSRSVAQFFFEVGYGACFAEVTVRNDCKPPFDLTDEHVEQAFPRSIEAHEDGAEMDRYLTFADTPPPAADGEREALHQARIWFELALAEGDAGTDFLNEGGWESAVAVLGDILAALRNPEPHSGGEGSK